MEVKDAELEKVHTDDNGVRMLTKLFTEREIRVLHEFCQYSKFLHLVGK